MYYCPECGFHFEKPIKTYSTHGFTSPPYEKNYCCPNCNSVSFYEKNTTHCRCCGAKLRQGITDYCSEACEKKGKKLWLKEVKRRQQFFFNPINSIVRELEIYNKMHGTNYSYGKYIAIILPEEKRKNAE